MKTKNISFLKISAVLFMAAASFSVQAQNVMPAFGNVGIGVNPALYPLHVSSSAHYGIVVEGSEKLWAGMLMSGKGAASQPFYEYATANGKGAWHYMNTRGDWNLNTGGVDRFSVKSDGSVNVLINPNPGGYTAQAVLNIGNFYINDISYSGPGAPTHNEFTIGKGTKSSFMIDEIGNVGINTRNPMSEFSVNGTITADELIVQEVGADYVFDEQYKLKSLTEVEAFIKTNKHLPGIAPAAETEKGIKV